MESSIATDIAAIQSITAVPSILRAVAELTGLRFVCVARVTGNSWTTCAVLDKIGFGLKPGDALDVATTLCSEVRDSGAPVIIDHASEDKTYCNHLTPRMYGFESYISIPLHRANGEFFGTLCGLDPLPANISDEKNISSMKLFTELISLQLEAGQRYEESQAALFTERETAELREQFIAVLGHDIRTPLASIITGADILLNKSLDTNTRSVVERIQRSGQRISRLVDDVLDFARGRLGGGIALDFLETDTLADDLRQVIAELQDANPHRAIRYELDIVGKVVCSPDRISQLLANLLANALNYSAPDTPVNVAARYHREGTFTLSVKNQGAAIPPETISRLFQPYWRAPAKSPPAGLGLGLYIATEIARSHGGKLDVTSSDEATIFTFTLPNAAASKKQRENVNS